MSLHVVLVDHRRRCPMLFCDVCHGRIDRDHPGHVEFPSFGLVPSATEPPDVLSGHVWFVHKDSDQLNHHRLSGQLAYATTR